MLPPKEAFALPIDAIGMGGSFQCAADGPGKSSPPGCAGYRFLLQIFHARRIKCSALSSS